MADLQVAVKIAVQSTEAVAGLANVKNEMAAVEGQAAKSSGVLSQFAGVLGPLGIVASAGAAVAAIGSFVKAAADEDVGIQRLTASLAAQGISYQDNQSAIESLIDAREKLAFADDQQRDAIAELIRHTHDLTEAQNLEAIAMDLARAKGMSLVEAATLVGKVHDGNVTILKRYGVAVADGASATEALASLQKQFAGQAAAYADTATGKWEQFENELGNVKETIGQSLLPALTEAGQDAADLMQELQDSGAAEGFGKGLATVLHGVLEPIKDVLARWRELKLEIAESGKVIDDVLRGDWRAAWQDAKALTEQNAGAMARIAADSADQSASAVEHGATRIMAAHDEEAESAAATTKTVQEQYLRMAQDTDKNVGDMISRHKDLANSGQALADVYRDRVAAEVVAANKRMADSLAQAGLALANSIGEGGDAFQRHTNIASAQSDSAVAAHEAQIAAARKAAEEEIDAAHDAAERAKEARLHAAEETKDRTIAAIDAEEKAYDANAERQIRDAERARDARIKAAEEARDAALKAIQDEQDATAEARIHEDRNRQDARAAQDRLDRDAEEQQLARERIRHERVLDDYDAERKKYEDRRDAALAGLKDQADDEREYGRLTLRGLDDQAKAQQQVHDEALRQIQAQQDAEERRHRATMDDIDREAEERIAPLEQRLRQLDDADRARDIADTNQRLRQSIASAQEELRRAQRERDPAAIRRAERALQDAQTEQARAGIKQREDAERLAIRDQIQQIKDQAKEQKDAEDARTAAVKDGLQQRQQAENDAFGIFKARIDAEKQAVQDEVTTTINGYQGQEDKAREVAKLQLDRLEVLRNSENATFAERNERIKNTYANQQEAIRQNRLAEDRSLEDSRRAQQRHFQQQAAEARATYEAQRAEIEDTYNNPDHGEIPRIRQAQKEAHDAFEARKKDAEAHYKAEQAEIHATFDDPATGLLPRLEKAKEDTKTSLESQLGEWKKWADGLVGTDGQITRVSAGLDVLNSKMQAAVAFDPSGVATGNAAAGRSAAGSVSSGVATGNSAAGAAKFSPPGGGSVVDMSDPQFGGAWSAGWDQAAVNAACGAIAAEGFADYYGKGDYTVGQILKLAEKGGYWSRAGWTGPANWSRFMNTVIGIPTFTTNLKGAIEATSEGKPVAISSPNWFHYFLAQAWDGERFFVGNTGSNALKHGSAWMTPAQIGLGSTYIRSHLNGGWLTEPILGVGLRTGEMHSFVENGVPERVVPAGRSASGIVQNFYAPINQTVQGCAHVGLDELARVSVAA